jgi:hypothetical protein
VNEYLISLRTPGLKKKCLLLLAECAEHMEENRKERGKIMQMQIY